MKRGSGILHSIDMIDCFIERGDVCASMSVPTSTTARLYREVFVPCSTAWRLTMGWKRERAILKAAASCRIYLNNASMFAGDPIDEIVSSGLCVVLPKFQGRRVASGGWYEVLCSGALPESVATVLFAWMAEGVPSARDDSIVWKGIPWVTTMDDNMCNIEEALVCPSLVTSNVTVDLITQGCPEFDADLVRLRRRIPVHSDMASALAFISSCRRLEHGSDPITEFRHLVCQWLSPWCEEQDVLSAWDTMPLEVTEKTPWACMVLNVIPYIRWKCSRL